MKRRQNIKYKFMIPQKHLETVIFTREGVYWNGLNLVKLTLPISIVRININIVNSYYIYCYRTILQQWLQTTEYWYQSSFRYNDRFMPIHYLSKEGIKVIRISTTYQGHSCSSSLVFFCSLSLRQYWGHVESRSI